MTDRTKVFHGDCMTFMKDYPDKHFELAIVDPEYGINIANRNGSIGQKKGQGKITSYSKKSWDLKPVSGEYFTELFRVSVNQVVWGGNYFTPHLPPSKNWVVWDKGQPEGVTFSMYELAYTSFDDGQAMIFRKTFASSCNKVANNNAIARTYAKIHPAQKPVPLYKWLLKNYAKEGDKILDTHMGSQSSRIAAFDMGFEYVGFELDKDYFDAGCKRFEQHKAQLKLFTV